MALPEAAYAYVLFVSAARVTDETGTMALILTQDSILQRDRGLTLVHKVYALLYAASELGLECFKVLGL